MSKMDELRALREARYEHTLARAAAHRAGTSRAGTATPGAPGRTPRPPATPATPAGPGSERPEPPPVELPEAADERLCGHRAISGRTCTREHGHAAKSHRYS